MSSAVGVDVLSEMMPSNCPPMGKIPIMLMIYSAITRPLISRVTADCRAVLMEALIMRKPPPTPTLTRQESQKVVDSESAMRLSPSTSAEPLAIFLSSTLCPR